MGGGVSKNNSGHAPPPSPEQIIKVGHLSSNFQITFIIHQGAEAAGEIWPRHRPQTKTIKTLKNCAKFAETFTKKKLGPLLAIFVSGTFYRLPPHFGRRRELLFWSFQYRFSQICLDLKSLSAEICMLETLPFIAFLARGQEVRASVKSQE